MGLWDSIKTDNAPSTSPTNGLWGGVTPSKPQVSNVPGQLAPQAAQVQKNTGLWASVPTPAPAPTQKTDTPAPFFTAVDKSGNSFGFSEEKDVSGIPFFAYRNPGDQSTTTDKTRVAFRVDPRVAAPTTKTDRATPRDAQGEALQRVLQDAGPKDQIDHQMALGLGGSNDPSNLKKVPATQNQAAGKQEGVMSNEIASGSISMFQAQVKEAKDKGLPLPWTGQKTDAQALTSFTKAITSGLGNAGVLVYNTINHAFESVDKSLSQAKVNPIKTTVPDNSPLGYIRNTLMAAMPKAFGPNKAALSAVKEEARSGFESLFNFVSDAANLISNIGKAPAQGEGSDNGGFVPSVRPSDFSQTTPIKVQPTTPYELSHTVAPENIPANFAGHFIGGSIPYLAGGEVIAPLVKTLQSAPVVTRIVGTALINSGVPALFRQVAPLQDGETHTSRFLSHLPEDILFGVTSSVIPNKALAALATGGSQFTVGAIKHEDLGQNILNSALLTIMGFAGHEVNNAEALRQRAESIANYDLGEKPQANDVAVQNMAREYLKSKDYEQKSFFSQAKTIIQNVVDYHNSIPNKKGGFVKNPFGSGSEEAQSPVNEKPADNTPVYEGGGDVSLKTLEKLQGRSSVSKQFISDLTNAGDLKQSERDIVRSVLSDYPDGSTVPVKEFANKVKSELLPLDVTSSAGGEPRYEHVALPDESRGEIQDYQEKVYQSPVKTSAGDVHFGGADEGADRYFGHTRVEDVPGGTRRVIEVQSDLYQKGNLEKEIPRVGFSGNGKYNVFDKNNNLIGPQFDTQAEAQTFANKGVAKLAQYNNPTAHFRMVREELKAAATDGKTKIQFPTGETAMKIEGLGDRTAWVHLEGPKTDEALRSGDLNVGMKVAQRNGEVQWIITDVLGDGKFKAVPKNSYEKHQKNLVDAPEKSSTTLTRSDYEQELNAVKETFDISGKVDTDNPIYKFYEKDLGKYLTSKYDAKVVTDDQGVSWYEVPVSKEMAKKPVEAFKLSSQGRTRLREGVKWTPKQAHDVVRLFFTPAESEFIPSSRSIESGNLNSDYRGDVKIRGTAFIGVDRETAQFRSFIKVLAEEGKIPDDIVLHEVFEKAVQVAFDDKAFEGVIKNIIKSPLSVFLRDKYPEQIYNTKELRAKEVISDDFVEFVRDQAGYTGKNRSIWERLLQWVRGLWRKTTGAQKLYEDLLAGKRMKDMSSMTDLAAQYGLSAEIPDEVREAEFQKKAESLDHERTRYEIKREEMRNHPLRPLEKYVVKDGNMKGSLPELGVGKSEFARNGDQIIDDMIGHGKYAEDVRSQFHDEYQSLKEEVKILREELKADEEHFKEQLKAEAQAAEDARVAKLDPDITHANNGVYPLPVRGGVVSPEAVWSEWKDIAAIRLSRDTMERNIEKVAPPDQAKAFNEFLVQHIRDNELARVKWANDIRDDFAGKIKEWGIKKGSDDDALIQMLGEGRMNIEEVRQASPKKYKEIQKASDYFRKQYDHMLDEWNFVRATYGYRPVQARPDYFRHFTEINEFTKAFGFITNDKQLPTEISGITHTFRPGKPFSTAEMHRTGDKTKFSAIGGMDNYIDSVGRQMFHIDSIQRGTSIINYLKDTAKATVQSTNPVVLPNFMANIREYTQLVAGKSSAGDQFVSSLFGRPALRFMQKVTQIFGRNVIAGNISAAVSHLIPAVLNAATVDKVPLVKGLMDTVFAPIKKGSLTTIDNQESSFMVRRFPQNHIADTNFQKAEQTLAFIFHTSDQFISRMAVSSKYFELKNKGMNPIAAMKGADNYAQRVIGDRSIGNLPNIMNTKALGFITQFQVEINDNISVLIHDIPRWEGESFNGKTGENEKSSKSGKYAKTIGRLVQFAIFSYLFNELLKKIKGSGKGMDPIDLAMTLLGKNDEGADKPFAERASLAGTDLIGELPFTSIFTGEFPAKKPVTDLLTAVYHTLTFKPDVKEIYSAAANFASPIGGGSQIKKTIEGVQAYRRGYEEDNKGNPSFPIEQNLPNALRAALFGSSSFPEKVTDRSSTVTLKDLSSLTTKKDKEFLPTYNKIAKLADEGKNDEAAALWDALNDEDKKTFKRLSTSAKSQSTLQRKKNVLPKVKQAMELMKVGKNDEAGALWEGLSEEDQKAFNSIYKQLNP